jgi:hypothetical protein
MLNTEPSEPLSAHASKSPDIPGRFSAYRRSSAKPEWTWKLRGYSAGDYDGRETNGDDEKLVNCACDLLIVIDYDPSPGMPGLRCVQHAGGQRD